jgi:hypothetical protein
LTTPKKTLSWLCTFLTAKECALRKNRKCGQNIKTYTYM